MKTNTKILSLLATSSLTLGTLFAQDLTTLSSQKLCPKLKFNLHRGSIDARTKGEVSVLQNFLKQNLNLNDTQFLVTGIYGKVTEKYVKIFEQEKNLKVDGFLSREVRDSILNLCNSNKTVEDKKKVSSKYKDGEYNVTTSYSSPGGQDDLGVNITLQSDKILNVNVINLAKDFTSKSFQDSFILGINNNSCGNKAGFNKVNIIGKNIEGLQIDKVCGASLTTGGFNSALEKIRSQALN